MQPLTPDAQAVFAPGRRWRYVGDDRFEVRTDKIGHADHRAMEVNTKLVAVVRDSDYGIARGEGGGPYVRVLTEGQ